MVESDETKAGWLVLLLWRLALLPITAHSVAPVMERVRHNLQRSLVEKSGMINDTMVQLVGI